MSDDDDEPVRHDAHRFQNQFIEQARNYCQLGATDAQLARFFKVDRTTIHNWRASRPEFAEACRIGKEFADDEVERSLYERARGYDYRAEKPYLHEGKPVIVRYQEHVPADVKASTFWLGNRQPEKWRERQQLEHTGKDGGPIETREMGPTDLARRISHIIEAAANQTDNERSSEPVPETDPDPEGNADK